MSVLSAPECWDKASRFCELAKEDSRAGCRQILLEKVTVQSWVLSQDCILSDQLFSHKKNIFYTQTHAL